MIISGYHPIYMDKFNTARPFSAGAPLSRSPTVNHTTRLCLDESHRKSRNGIVHFHGVSQVTSLSDALSSVYAAHLAHNDKFHQSKARLEALVCKKLNPKLTKQLGLTLERCNSAQVTPRQTWQLLSLSRLYLTRPESAIYAFLVLLWSWWKAAK